MLRTGVVQTKTALACTNLSMERGILLDILMEEDTFVAVKEG